MGLHERPGASDDWYTPHYVFDALGLVFDLDVASPPHTTHVPCIRRLSADSLTKPWRGVVWMNPPYGGRNGVVPWLQKFIAHGNGVALVPDRTSAPWFAFMAANVELLLFVSPKIKFERPDGSLGNQPGNGSVLAAIGERPCAGLRRAHARKLGFLASPVTHAQ